MLKAVLSSNNMALNKAVDPNLTLKSHSLEGSDSKSYETRISSSQPFFQNPFSQKISVLESELQNILSSKMSDEQKMILYRSSLNELFLADKMRKTSRNLRPPLLPPRRVAAAPAAAAVAPPLPPPPPPPPQPVLQQFPVLPPPQLTPEKPQSRRARRRAGKARAKVPYERRDRRQRSPPTLAPNTPFTSPPFAHPLGARPKAVNKKRQRESPPNIGAYPGDVDRRITRSVKRQLLKETDGNLAYPNTIGRM